MNRVVFVRSADSNALVVLIFIFTFATVVDTLACNTAGNPVTALIGPTVPSVAALFTDAPGLLSNESSDASDSVSDSASDKYGL
jgi:hypothetical protein